MIKPAHSHRRQVHFSLPEKTPVFTVSFPRQLLNLTNFKVNFLPSHSVPTVFRPSTTRHRECTSPRRPPGSRHPWPPSGHQGAGSGLQVSADPRWQQRDGALMATGCMLLPTHLHPRPCPLGPLELGISLWVTMCPLPASPHGSVCPYLFYFCSE